MENDATGQAMVYRSILKYPGAKNRIADWIIGHFPEHHSYLEPYMGSCAVLFNKPPARIETVNDLDDEVVNLFQVVREWPEELAAAISLTPYDRHEYGLAFEVEKCDKDPITKARRFLVRCWQSHGFRQNHYKVGWRRDVQGREAAYAARHWSKLPSWICDAAMRLKQVQIEHQDAVELIGAFNYPNVLIYADPPYVLSTRSGKTYKHEMSDADHVHLLEALLRHRGPVVLSGYDNPLYTEHLAGWGREQIAATASHGQPRVEMIWMNFEMQLRLPGF